MRDASRTLGAKMQTALDIANNPQNPPAVRQRCMDAVAYASRLAYELLAAEDALDAAVLVMPSDMGAILRSG